MQVNAVWRSVALSVGASLLGLLVLAAFARRQGGLAGWDRLDADGLLAALAAMLLAWWLRAARFQVLARAVGRPIGGWEALRYFLASAFVSHVTPTSGGGLPAMLYFLHRAGLGPGRAIAVVAVDGALTALLFLVVVPMALLLWRFRAAGLGWLPPYAEVGLWGVVAAAVALLYLLARPDHLERVLGRAVATGLARRWLGPGRRERWARRLVREARRYRAGIRTIFFKRPLLLTAAAVLTLAHWAAYLSVAPILIEALGGDPAWERAIGAQLLFNAVQPLIPTPGGSGGAELGLALLFRHQLPAGSLALFVALWRLLTFYLSLAVGGAAFLFCLGSGGRPSPGRPRTAVGFRSAGGAQR